MMRVDVHGEVRREVHDEVHGEVCYLCAAKAGYG